MPDDETDAEAIVASIGEPARFEIVFRRHYQQVRTYLQRRVGRELGEDLAARTFLQALERRSSYDPRYPSAKPWLFAIATNLLRHHLRDEARHLRTLRSMPPAETSVDDEEERLTSLGLRPILVTALQALADDERDALLLSVHGGLRYQEIALALNVPLGTVRSRIHRAKGRLREQLPPLVDIWNVPEEGAEHG